MTQNVADIPPLSPYRDTDVLTSPDLQRLAVGAAASLVEGDKQLPPMFPTVLWNTQAARYMEYWAWYTGEALAREESTNSRGEKVSKFPLAMNVVRDFSRKHAAILFGVVPDRPQALVKTMVYPKPSWLGGSTTDTQKTTAHFLSAIVNEVWKQSGGRGKMLENGILSQFLGGCFFQIDYVPQEKKRLNVPIKIKALYPDFVLPIWSKDDPDDLLEAWIVYRIPKKIVAKQFGLDEKDSQEWSIYAEYWDKKTFSIWIDGKPVVERVQNWDGTVSQRTYLNYPHPYETVPIFYIPRVRTGTFYGESMVPDIKGLTLEYNGRFADMGTLVHQLAHRRYFGRNLTSQVKNRQFDNGAWFTDLGNENPSMKNPPEMFAVDPPNLGDYVLNNVNLLWLQLLRHGNLTPVHFGEDEGSQRSGETLKTRFWPSTAIAKIQRLNWDDGLNRIARTVLRMCAIHQINIEGTIVPEDFEKTFDFAQDWAPMVERDRQAVVDEIVQLAGVNRQSPESAIEKLGDVHDEEQELALIWEAAERMAKIEASAKPPPSESTAASG